MATSNTGIQLNEAFEYILRNYNASKNEAFSSHPLGNFIRRDIKQLLFVKGKLNPNAYKITGSTGQGNWAEIPWVCVFDRGITEYATSGYYIVYLFSADMQSFYISLNQGWTYFQEKYGTTKGKQKIRHTASIIRNKLHNIPINMNLTSINLVGTGRLSRGYEDGHLIGKQYHLNALPSTEDLITDLQSLLISYKEIANLKGNRTISEFNDYLLLNSDDQYFEEESDDVSFQNRVQEVVKGATRNVNNAPIPLPRKEPIIEKNGVKKWPRDAAEAAQALEMSGYVCTYDPTHSSFTSKVSGKPYLEVHHLVPMKYQGDFTMSLDRSVQLIALCPTCHRCIHHGTDNDKIIMLEKLYEQVKDDLIKIGIQVTLKRLKEMYNIKFPLN